MAEDCTMMRLDVCRGIDPDLPILSAPSQEVSAQPNVAMWRE